MFAKFSMQALHHPVREILVLGITAHIRYTLLASWIAFQLPLRWLSFYAKCMNGPFDVLQAKAASPGPA